MPVHDLLFAGAAPGLTYYASGSNHPGEILGFAESGIHVGVSAREVGSRAEHAMVQAARDHGVRIFIDSGAFAELSRDGKPGQPPDWPQVLGLYQRMADRIAPSLTVVAPDMVGNQEETLARMRAHAGPCET